MLTALLDDKADFVRLFLESGLSMREFLTVERLRILYRSVSRIPRKFRRLKNYNDYWMMPRQGQPYKYIRRIYGWHGLRLCAKAELKNCYSIRNFGMRAP